jgi:hypothetical protein
MQRQLPKQKLPIKTFFQNLADVARETKIKSALKMPKLPTHNFHFQKKFASGVFFLPAALSTFRHEKECLDENRPFLATLSVKATIS